MEGVCHKCILGCVDNESALAHVLAYAQKAKEANATVDWGPFRVGKRYSDGRGGHPDVGQSPILFSGGALALRQLDGLVDRVHASGSFHLSTLTNCF